MKNALRNSVLKIISPAIAGVVLGLLPNGAKAQTQYFTTVANDGTYSWDAANWTTNGAVANTPPYATAWNPGNFARFYSGAGDSYTVTVNQAESMSGMFQSSGSSAILSINDAGNGTGSLSIVPNATAQATQNGFSWLTQGFLTGGGIVTINAPITGTGGVEEESGGGHLQLYGNNSFTGGFLAISSSTFIDYNNNNSFGAASSQIGFDGTTFAIMENTGPSTVNIANPVQTIGNTGVNFIGNGVTMSGNWYLGGGSAAINIRNNGTGTHVYLTGVLSGTSGAVSFSGANGGYIHLVNANTYTGTTTIGLTGDTSITLSLDAAGALGDSSKIILAGGTLMPTVNQTMTGTLGLTTSSTINFDGGTLSFANSSPLTWSGKLDLLNWDNSDDLLQIGTDGTGLTTAQLADIEFDGDGTSEAAINSAGFIYEVPEPTTLALAGFGGLSLLFLKRRKA